jgi:hypothetical protein
MQFKYLDLYRHVIYIDINTKSVHIKLFRRSTNKSPGEDGIITEFYQLFWQDIKNEFFEVIEKIFKFEYTLASTITITRPMQFKYLDLYRHVIYIDINTKSVHIKLFRRSVVTK